MNSPLVFTIGRAVSNDICMGEGDLTISREHAEIVCARSGGFLLVDKASTCGTFIEAGGNWKPVKQEVVDRYSKVRLGNGDTIVTIDQLVARASM